MKHFDTFGIMIDCSRNAVMTPDSLKKLIDILTDINEDVDFANEKALVDDGLIDSFDITSIITALDEEYDVRIEASEIEPENFNSVEAILETVKKYQAKRR